MIRLRVYLAIQSDQLHLMHLMDFFYIENLSCQTETREIKREHISVILNGWMNFMALDVFKGHISEMNAAGRV